MTYIATNLNDEKPLNKYFQNDYNIDKPDSGSLRGVSATCKVTTPYIDAKSDFTTKATDKTEEQVQGIRANVKPISNASDINKTNNQNLKNTDVLPTYTTSIIKSEKELHAILGNELQANPQANISYITEFNDLSEGNLTKKYILSKDNATSEITLNEELGSLFTNSKDPVILVIDYRNINIDTIVEFNSLYDKPPTLDSKPLASNVKIISLVGTDLADEEGPGSDFWRRVFETDNFIDTTDSKYLTSNSLFSRLETEVIQEADEPAVEDKNTLIIKLAGENWRNELFGHLDLDTEDSLCYTPGQLATLNKNQRVYFQDSPLYDKNFALEIDKMIRDGGYTANGKFIKLPENLKFYHCQTDDNKLEILQNQFSWDIPKNQPNFAQSGKTKILNETSFFYYTQRAAVKDGKLIKRDVFKDWIGDDTSVIRVTTKLSVNQWYVLLNRLKKLGRTDICIIQDNPDLQPTGWSKINKFQQQNNAVNNNIKVVLNDLGLIPDVLEKQQKDQIDYLDVQLSPDSYASRLTSKINNISLEKRLFDIKNTEFLQALESGRPINIYGLKYNFKLMLELESLLGEPPSLIVDGFYRTFPKAKINFHLPNDTTTPTKLWVVAKDRAEEVYRDSLKTIKNKLAEKYNQEINQKLTSEMFDLIVDLVQETNNMPMIGKSPRSKIVLCGYFFDKIWRQAILEQQLDGTKKINKSYFMKALNSIFTKRYRDEPENYRYIKFCINKHFSIIPNAVDLIGLQHWIRNQKTITKELIQENFWTLSQYIPYNNLKLVKTKFQKFLNAFTLANIKAFFSINNLINGIKSLASSLLSLLKHAILMPYYIVKNIRKLINHCLIFLSRIIPWMETRVYPESLRVAEKTKFSLKDAAAASGEALDFVYKTILATMEDEAQKVELQTALNISDKAILKHTKTLNKYTNNCYQVEKILRDICYSVDFNSLDAKTRREIESHGYQQLCHDLSFEITKKVLELKNTQNENKEATKLRIIAEINQCLNKILPGDKNVTDRAEIAEDLLLCTEQATIKSFWKYWFQRRMIRCANRVKTHPLTMIKGYSGSGKSYIAKKVAKMLNPNEDPITINVKADMSAEDIYGSFKLDNKELTYIKGKLRQWAEKRDGEHHTIILDEFTLANVLWDSIRTMAANPPYINIDGEKIYLTDKHHIIMTSNPDYFPGRKVNEVLTSMMAEMFYFPLAKGFQKQQIVAPVVSKFIDRINFSPEINIKTNAVDKITTCVHDLYTQYAKLIPDYEFTPRDLTDCCSRMEVYFSDYITGKNKDKITIDMIYDVAREAMKQSIANALPTECYSYLEAIDTWHKARFPGNNKILKEMENRYNDFYNNFELFLRQHGNKNFQTFDLNNKVTQKLLKIYFTEFLRLNLEVETGKIHEGRHAVLVKSMPGQAKDVLWLMLVEYVKAKHGIDLKNNSYTANHKSIETIGAQTETKFKTGGVMSVSELNAYDTQSIEGLLNDLLTDSPKAPGFLFLATINDAKTTRGRHELSPALLSRFSKNNIENYSFNDFKNICKQQIDHDDYADLIIKAHWRVMSAMAKGKKNALPSIADIKKVAYKASKPNLVSKTDLSNILIGNYGKYLKLLGWDNNKITNFFKVDKIDDEIIETNYMRDLTIWINQRINNKCDAIVVNKGIITNYSITTGILTLSKQDQEKTINEKKKIILDAINSGLSTHNQQQEIVIPEAEPDVEVEVDVVDSADNKIENGNQTEIEPKVKIKIKPQTIIDDSSNITTNIDKTIKVSHDSPVDQDVKKLLSSKKYVYRYELPDLSFVERQILKALPISENIEKIISDYFAPKVKEIPDGMLKSRLDTILSDKHDQTRYLKLYNPGVSFFNMNAEKLKVPATKEVKNLATRALAELQSNQLLRTSETKKLFVKYKKNEDNILNLLRKIKQMKDPLDLRISEEFADFKLLLEINSPICNMLGCSILTFRESFQWIDSFTSTIARGNINCNTAIELIESTNNVLIKYLASKDILYKCCKTLKEGKNIENISAIVKHLIKRDGDYFDSKTLYSLLKISEIYELEDLVKEVKKVIDSRYQRMLTREIKISATESKKTDVAEIEKNISPQTKTALTNIINNNLDKMLQTDTEQTEVNTWKPTGNINVPNFLSGKPPFKDILTQNVASKDVMVIGAPTMPSLRLAATFYHKPTNKIINLGQFLFDEIGHPKFLGGAFSSIDKKIEAEIIEYLTSFGININVNFEYELLLKKLIRELQRLYDDEQGKYDFKSSEICNKVSSLLHDFHSKSINEHLKNYLNDMVHIPSTYITKLMSEQILKRTGKLQYCLNLSHSSEVGTVTVKNATDLQRVDQYIDETTLHRPLLHLCNIPHNLQEYTEVVAFEKNKIREFAGNNNATVLHQQDIENLMNQS